MLRDVARIGLLHALNTYILSKIQVKITVLNPDGSTQNSVTGDKV